MVDRVTPELGGDVSDGVHGASQINCGSPGPSDRRPRQDASALICRRPAPRSTPSPRTVRSAIASMGSRSEREPTSSSAPTASTAPFAGLLWAQAAGPVHIGVTAWRGLTPWHGELVAAISWDRGAATGPAWRDPNPSTAPTRLASAQVSHIRCFFGPYYWDPYGRPALSIFDAGAGPGGVEGGLSAVREDVVQDPGAGIPGNCGARCVDRGGADRYRV